MQIRTRQKYFSENVAQSGPRQNIVLV